MKDYTDEQLKAELQRRKAARNIKIEPELRPNYTELEELCASYVEFVMSTDYHEDNDWGQGKYYVFEVALKAVYGDEIFEKLSEYEV